MEEKLLVVDDDRNICELLGLYLHREGYRVLFAHDGSQALDLYKKEKPDLVILDIMLPLISGWEVCRLLRESEDVPIIMLTALDKSEEKVTGLDMGADDYVVKPFDPNEVTARVRARLRQKPAKKRREEETLVIENLLIDRQKFEVLLEGKAVDLTPREFQLLHYMALNKNSVLTREQILEKVWGYTFAGETRTVDIHVKRLRKKLKPGAAGWRIKTIYGLGYKFEVRE